MPPAPHYAAARPNMYFRVVPPYWLSSYRNINTLFDHRNLSAWEVGHYWIAREEAQQSGLAQTVVPAHASDTPQEGHQEASTGQDRDSTSPEHNDDSRGG